MPKNIVICCDGTGNEFGRQNSNVIKLYKTLVCDNTQIAYYHPGLGTMGARNALTPLAKWWTKVLGQAFGYGISDNVADAYQFLMRTFEPDDKLFIFGFSRGAYTAKALCGMLHIVGLLTQGNEALIPYAIRMIKRNLDFKVAAGFKKTFSRPCKPHFVGLWDAVSSVGWVYNAVHFPYTRAATNPDFHIVRHAMSIDERRAFFRQNLFGEPHDANQDIKEVWFAGVHSDVGGSYPEDQSQLSRIALRWMLCEAERADLVVDQQEKARQIGKEPPEAPDPTGEQHNSLHGFWWIAEVWPKIVHKEKPDHTWRKALHVNLGRRRYIAPNCLVHSSVEVRPRSRHDYQPSNLPQERQVLEDRCGQTAEGTYEMNQGVHP